MDPERLKKLWKDVLGPDPDWSKLSTVASYRRKERRPLPFPAQPGEAYKQLEVVGRGGLGIIHRAWQINLGREVALKSARDLAEGDAESAEDARDNFLAEALVTGRLEHPNIVPVHDLLVHRDGTLQLSMKLVRGRSWAEVLREDGIADFDRHLEILLLCCHAVAFAHSRGVVHNDLKPANVMVGEFGEVLVMDWGLALEFGDQPTMDGLRHTSGLSGPCGTPAYMPPELAEGRGEEIGPWTDVYLLGAILYELLSGKAPHHRQSFLQVLLDAVSGVIPPLPDELPAELRAICMRALAAEPVERYPTVLEFQSALKGFQLHEKSLQIGARAWRKLEACQEAAAQGPQPGPDALSALYEGFVQAIACFEQAEQLWIGNRGAAQGLREARQAYAETALKQGDLVLAKAQLSKLDPHDSQRLRLHLDRASRRRRREKSSARRLRNVMLLSALLLFCGLLLGLVVVGSINRELETQIAMVREARGRADSAAVVAQRQSLYNQRRGAIAIAALDDLVGEVQVQLLQHGSDNTERVALDLLKRARDRWAELREADISEQRVSHSSALISLKLGELLLRADGDLPAALEMFEEARTSLARLLRHDPDSQPVRRALADALLWKGVCLTTMGAVTRALEPLEEAYKVSSGLPLEDHSDSAHPLGLRVEILMNRARALQLLGRLTEARRDFEAALSMAAPDFRSAHGLIELASLLASQGQVREGERICRESIELMRGRIQEDPQHAELKTQLARAYATLAGFLRAAGDLEAARLALEQGITWRRRLHEQYPGRTLNRIALAAQLAELGRVILGQGQLAAAEDRITEAVVRLEELRAQTAMREPAERLVVAWTHRAVLLRMRGDSDGALQAASQGLALQEEMLRTQPDLAEWRFQLAQTHNELARILGQRGEHEQASAHQRRGLELCAQLLQIDASHMRARFAWAEGCLDLAELENQAGRPVQADSLLAASESELRTLEVETSSPIQVGLALANVLVKRASLSRIRLLPERALAQAAEAWAGLESLTGVLEAEPLSNLKGLALRELGRAQLEMQDLESGAEALQQAFAIASDLAQRRPENAQYQTNLLSVHAELAVLCKETGDPEGAAELFGFCVERAGALIAEDSSNVLRRQALLAVSEQLGKLHLETGDPGAAALAFRRGLDCARSHPLFAAHQTFWSNRLGAALHLAGRQEAALEVFTMGIEAGERVWAESANQALQADLAEAWYRKAAVDFEREDFEAATEACARSWSLFAEIWPRLSGRYSVVLLCLHLQARLAELAGDAAAQLEAYQRSEEIAGHQHRQQSGAQSARDLVIARILLAAAQRRADKKDEARQLLRAALDEIEPFVEQIEDGESLRSHLQEQLEGWE